MEIRDQQRADCKEARRVLQGEEIDAKVAFALAERLKGVNEFGYARRLYGRLRKRKKEDLGGLSPVKLGQRHALCTYKDSDSPAAARFKRALEILDEVDALQLDVAQLQESFGMRASVHKRRWQLEGQLADLQLALAFYTKGYRAAALDPQGRPDLATDQGYNAINAAYVLDLLACEDARQAAVTQIRPTTALDRFREARAIRRHLTECLPPLLARPGLDWLSTAWWFHATVAEANVGTGNFEAARTALLAYNVAHGIALDKLPVEIDALKGRVAPWEFESTITQLVSLVSLQAQTVELFQRAGVALDDIGMKSAEALREGAKRSMEQYLGRFSHSLDRGKHGKVGLALSGGGFRASLFHIGVLAYLAERDALRHVEVLSCVSGGSIVGAHYYLELKQLLQTKVDPSLAGTADEPRIDRDDYVRIVQRVQAHFLKGIQRNIRSRLFSSVWVNLRTMLQPSYTTTQRLGELYEQELYSQVADGHGGQPRYMQQLVVQPRGEHAGFRPSYDNWKRQHKVPVLVLNATTLNTGHNWQFTATWMGEPALDLDGEIDGNYELRRLAYVDAPKLRDRWRKAPARWFAPLDYERLRLGHAVAASSCVPALFEPLVLQDLYPKKVVRLVDGGLHDNQGVASLLEQDCSFVIVSDASGQMDAQDDPASGRLGVALRSISVSAARVRQTQFRELAARARSGLLKRFGFLHLKKDLDADPIDWRDCQDPHDASEETARPANRRGPRTSYGVLKSVQRHLSAIRTDLDSFTDLEAFALMSSGYRQAERQFRDVDAWPASKPPSNGWSFRDVDRLLEKEFGGFEAVERQLKVGSSTLAKVWQLRRGLQILAVMLAAVLFAGVAYLVWTNWTRALVTVGGLATAIVIAALAAFGPSFVSKLWVDRWLRSQGLRALARCALAICFKVHLLLFDRWFLNGGRLNQFSERSKRDERVPDARTGMPLDVQKGEEVAVKRSP